MPERVAFDYAVVRVVPRVDLEEFVNAGVIVSCHASGFLAARVECDEDRLRALDPDVDLEAVRRHLALIPRICAGDADSGPIARLPRAERFDWLTAPRSAIIQTSAVHSGLCDDPDRELERLISAILRR